MQDGIVGKCNNIIIENCKNSSSATVEGDYKNTETIGGIAGFTENNTNILKSKNEGNVGTITAHSYSVNSNIMEAIGGIVGLAINTQIDQCYNTGSISAVFGNTGYGGTGIGGIVGWIESSTVNNVYNTGSVAGIEMIGGIFGGTEHYYNTNSNARVYLNNAYNSALSISGSNNADCISGYNKYITTDYVIWLSEGVFASSWGYWDDSTCQYPHYLENVTTAQLKTTNTLNYMLNGNGSGKWARNSGINDGLPYLVNNPPE